jgi:hypothetical protein
MEMLDRFADQILVSPTELAARWAQLEREMAVFALAVAHIDAGGACADDVSTLCVGQLGAPRTRRRLLGAPRMSLRWLWDESARERTRAECPTWRGLSRISGREVGMDPARWSACEQHRRL